MPNPVVHFEVIGKDSKKLQQFYSQLFDWKIDTSNPMDYGMIEAQGGQGIGGGVGGGPQAATCFYVSVADPQAYIDKAASMTVRKRGCATDPDTSCCMVSIRSTGRARSIAETAARSSAAALPASDAVRTTMVGLLSTFGACSIGTYISGFRLPSSPS